MTRAACAIGLDFGTESGRAVILDLASGRELSVQELRYPHGVIDRALPGSGEALPADWALQDPDDWIAVVRGAVPTALASAGVEAQEVIGLGVDFTSCTVLPVDADGVPLCTMARWRARPHAWPKLWKHHAAQPVADRLNEVAQARHGELLSRYGGRISSEWYFPKLIELWLEDREVFDAAHAFLEATDWIVWQLTGSLRRNACTAGYKAMWSDEDGPPSALVQDAYPGFPDPAQKLGTEFWPLGSKAGTLRSELAAQIGLGSDVAVAVGNVDSFVSTPGAGVRDPGTFLMVVGTSICDLVIHPQEIRLPGITGVVRDGILPGFYGYEAGQVAVGDMLAWFVTQIDRDSAGGERYEALERTAAAMGPGETGLVALDWWNGNRTILADADLTGVIAGLTLQTTREQMYRALMESIAFGNRRIMENFEQHGFRLTEIVACGGIADKSPLMMQMLADTSGRTVSVPDSSQIPARGAALFGAVAAGARAGGFDDISAAVEATRPPVAQVYEPDPDAASAYDAVYGVYRALYETLGRSQVEILHALKRLHPSASRPAPEEALHD